jgi:hypothetical protein
MVNVPSELDRISTLLSMQALEDVKNICGLLSTAGAVGWASTTGCFFSVAWLEHEATSKIKGSKRYFILIT